MPVPILPPISSSNGLTLNGVGNGTQDREYLHSESADDAIESLLAVRVNVNQLAGCEPDDDMFDFTKDIPAN